MNGTISLHATVVSFALAAAVVSHPVHAASRCDQPVVGGEARACAAAHDGTEALRRFVWRTRAIYGLNIQEFAPADANAVAATDTVSRVATSGVDPKMEHDVQPNDSRRPGQ